MTETYKQTDFDDPTQTGPAYPVYPRQVDKNFAVHNSIAGAFAAHEAAVPDMTAVVDAGSVLSGVVFTGQFQQGTELIAAPSINPRNDLVVVNDATGVVSVITGVEAVSPADPVILSGQIPVARIRLLTSTVVITNAIIDDLRSLIRSVSDKKGADVAAAPVLPLINDGRYNHVNGPGVVISSASSVYVGAIKILYIASNMEMEHHYQDLVLPGRANIKLQTGDVIELVEYSVGKWLCTNFQPFETAPFRLLSASKENTEAYFSTSLVSDTELAGFPLDASGRYEIEGYLPVASGNANPDFKFSFLNLGGGDSGFISVTAITGTSQTVALGREDTLFTVSLTQNVYTGIHIKGVVNIGPVGRFVSLQAGTVASNTVVSLWAGAVLTFTRRD